MGRQKINSAPKRMHVPRICFLALLQTLCLKTKEIYSVTVLAASNLKSSGWQGYTPAEGSGGESFLASPSFWRFLAFLEGSSGGTVVKNLPAHAGDARDMGSTATASTPVSACLHFHMTFLVYLCVSSLSSDFKDASHWI